jgi:hypothetical protein
VAVGLCSAIQTTLLESCAALVVVAVAFRTVGMLAVLHYHYRLCVSCGWTGLWMGWVTVLVPMRWQYLLRVQFVEAIRVQHQRL